MICRAKVDKIYYQRPFLYAVLVPYHIKTLGAKVGPPGFDPPGLLREVIFSYNKYVNFMTSSIKTSPKKLLRLVLGNVLLLSSCKNMQKYKIEEKSYIELYTVKCYLGKPRSYLDEIEIMWSFCRNDFNGALGSSLQVF